MMPHALRGDRFISLARRACPAHSYLPDDRGAPYGWHSNRHMRTSVGSVDSCSRMNRVFQRIAKWMRSPSSTTHAEGSNQ
jgi:hypothetical protein